MMIPTFLRNTEVEKFIENEIAFASQILTELRELNSNFIDINTTHINSRFVAIWLSVIFKIFYSRMQTTVSLAYNIGSVIFATKHIGTDESFVKLFKAFLNVDIAVTTPQAGVINIKLLSGIKTNFIAYISPSTKRGKRPKKILICQHREGYEPKCKALVFNYLPKGYSHSIYAFIKNLIPIGRVLRLIDKDNQDIISFNTNTNT
ncbi:hypothetical protein DB313_06195 (plasmid) [Borrelia turcica IST7]|uniref:DUF735 family protein n=1 Tax=Borrelia turcica IST7 TaxID=1104446 RepID=A0A386PRM5_9SPIR|nr:DUF735 family protein [Borrelia turcica]AYE37090.1 hypothetical protein DB313_06195 [Borrelia turcica IST7]